MCRYYLSIVIFMLVYLTYVFPQENKQIIPGNAKLEKLFDQGFSTEGPAEAPDGSIYFSDQTFTSESGMQAGHIWKYDPKAGRTVIFRSPSGMANGIEFDAKGNMLVAEGADFGGRCVISTDMQTAKSRIIAGLFNQKAFNSPNDLTIDAKSRIYFTDPRYYGHETIDQPVMGVYRIDPDGTIKLIIPDISMPNGIAVSPDQRTLYVGCFDEGNEYDSLAVNKRKAKMAILAYDLSEQGEASLRKVLVHYASEEGPDGISVDTWGNIYAAVRNESRPGVYVYNPEGNEIAYIPTPEVPSNLTFSRMADKPYLYITAGKSLYRIQANPKGYFLNPK